MTDEEIMKRANRAAHTFESEARRFALGSAEGALLIGLEFIATNVSTGEYHRGPIFKRMVHWLGVLGFDTSALDTTCRPESDGFKEAAENAKRDTCDLWTTCSRQNRGGERRRTTVAFVSRADDLIRAIGDDDADIERCADGLHDIVDRCLRLKAGGDLCETLTRRVTIDELLAEHDMSRKFAATLRECGEFPTRYLHVRELPERVIFNPPATVAFWGDGTKTVAKCAPGEEFSEYTGLLVCIAKRNVPVPRHAMFEDVMAKLLKRAERQGPKRAKAGDAA